LGLDYRLVGFSSVLYKLEMKSLMLKKETQECFLLGFDDLMRVDVLLELRVQLPMTVAPWNLLGFFSIEFCTLVVDDYC
jgi:hypothetical protein